MQIIARSATFGLAAGAQANSPIIDMGTDFLKKPHIIAERLGVASPGETLVIKHSNNSDMSASVTAPAGPGLGGDNRSPSNSTSATVQPGAVITIGNKVSKL